MKQPFRIELPTVFENMSVNSWLIEEPEVTLVDCGEYTPKAWQALNDALAQRNLKISDVKKVVITHGHVDHMGLANQIVQNSDATVYVNEYLFDWAVDLKKMLDLRSAAIEHVMKPLLSPTSFKRYYNFGYELLSPIWQEIPADRIKQYGINESLNLGGKEWRTIYTPGHCINQVCLFQEENGYLISADMLLKMIPIPIIDADIKPPYDPVQALVMHYQSYQKLRQLNISTVLPGHFEAFENAQDLIENQMNKIHRRMESCLTHVEKGIRDLEALTHQVYPGRVHQASLFMVVGLNQLLEYEGLVDRQTLEQFKLQTSLSN